MYMKAYYQHLKERKHPEHDNGKKVTQPDLSRTIRQILVDTMLGKPAPMSTRPLAPDDPEGKMTVDELHDLRVVSDKFEAIEGARLYARQAREREMKYKKKAEDYVQEQKKKAVKKTPEEIKPNNTNTATE